MENIYLIIIFNNNLIFIIYILSVYSPFSDRVGLPFMHSLSRGINEEYWSNVFRPDALLDVTTCVGCTIK